MNLTLLCNPSILTCFFRPLTPSSSHGEWVTLPYTSQREQPSSYRAAPFPCIPPAPSFLCSCLPSGLGQGPHSDKGLSCSLCSPHPSHPPHPSFFWIINVSLFRVMSSSLCGMESCLHITFLKQTFLTPCFPSHVTLIFLFPSRLNFFKVADTYFFSPIASLSHSGWPFSSPSPSTSRWPPPVVTYLPSCWTSVALKST